MILADFKQLTNEFRFPITAFHHAHETYLVPDLLKQAYGMSLKPRASHLVLIAFQAKFLQQLFSQHKHDTSAKHTEDPSLRLGYWQTTEFQL